DGRAAQGRSRNADRFWNRLLVSNRRGNSARSRDQQSLHGRRAPDDQPRQRRAPASEVQNRLELGDKFQLVPRDGSALERTNPSDAVIFQDQRRTGAGSFVRSGAK